MKKRAIPLGDEFVLQAADLGESWIVHSNPDPSDEAAQLLSFGIPKKEGCVLLDHTELNYFPHGWQA